jgi:hypothetical protein
MRGAHQQHAISSRHALLLAVVLLSPSRSFGGEPNTADKVLAGFQFEGIPLGTAFADFERQSPNAVARPNESEENVRYKSYIAAAKNSADAAMFRFFDDRLFRIEIVYTPSRLEKLGGATTITRKLVAMLGTPDETKQHKQGSLMIWNRPKVHRRAELTAAGPGVLLTVTDTRLEDALNQRRAKQADLGF